MTVNYSIPPRKTYLEKKIDRLHDKEIMGESFDKAELIEAEDEYSKIILEEVRVAKQSKRNSN